MLTLAQLSFITLHQIRNNFGIRPWTDTGLNSIWQLAERRITEDDMICNLYREIKNKIVVFIDPVCSCLYKVDFSWLLEQA